MVPCHQEVPIGAVGRILTVPFAGLAGLALLAAGFAGAVLPPSPRFLLAAAVMVWLPGIVIVRDLLGVRPRSALVRHPLYLLSGVSAVSVITWPFVFAGADFGVYRSVLSWAIALVLGAGAIRSWRRRQAGPRAGKGGAAPAVALVVLALAASAFVPGTPGVERDDYDHIGYIRQIEAMDSTSPSGVLARPVDTPERLPNDPRKGAWHAVIAAVASTAAVDPFDAWRLQPVLLFPFAFFAFLAFCREFVSTRLQLAACVVLFAFSYGGMGYRYPETVAYGQNLAVTWYWMTVPLVLGTGWASGRRAAAVLALLGAGGVFVHIGVALHVAVLAVTVVAGSRVLNGNGGAVRRVAVVAAAAVAAAVWRLAWASGEPNLIHMHEQGVLALGPWWVVSPMEVLRQHGMLFLGGLVITPLLVAWWGRPDVRRVLVFAVVPVLLCFVPFLATPLFREGTYLVARSLLNVPVFPAIVLAVSLLVTWARRPGRSMAGRAAAAVLLTLWGVVFAAPTARSVTRSFAAGAPDSGNPVSTALVDYLRRLPRDSVILSDPGTSYVLSALTAHRYVAVNGQHGNPLDPYAMDRLEAVRDVLSPYVVSARALAACERYGVDFVVCNARPAASARGFMVTWDSGQYPLTVARLESIGGSFRRVYDGDDFVVFLYDASGTGETVWGDSPPLLSFTPVAGMSRCVVNAPGGAFRVTGVAVVPGRALPGETVSVTLGYEKEREEDFGIPFVVYLRLDHESIEEGSDYPGAKHVRRFRERRDRVTLRLTDSHVPFEGLYAVDLWPIGRRFFETVDLPLPPNMLPGRYTLRVSIERASLLPNFSVADLLFNRDRLHGRACADVEVTRQRVKSP